QQGVAGWTESRKFSLEGSARHFREIRKQAPLELPIGRVAEYVQRGRVGTKIVAAEACEQLSPRCQNDRQKGFFECNGLRGVERKRGPIRVLPERQPRRKLASGFDNVRQRTCPARRRSVVRRWRFHGGAHVCFIPARALKAMNE